MKPKNIRVLSYSVFIFVATALFQIHCSSDSSGEREERQPATQNNQATQPTQNIPQTSDPTPTVQGPLPSYLFTLEQARALQPLVLSFVSFTDQTPNIQRLTQYEANLRDFLNRILSNPLLSPGRNLNVLFLADPEPNAAGGNNTVYLNLENWST